MKTAFPKPCSALPTILWLAFTPSVAIVLSLIGTGIKAIETAPFLDEEQKRDLLYNNAARFLRLSDAEIAKDHQ